MQVQIQKSLNLVSKIFAFCFLAAVFVHILFLTDADLYLNSDFISFLTGAKTVHSEPSKLYDTDIQLNIQKALKFEYEHQTRLYPRERLYLLLPYRNLPLVAYLFSPLIFFPGLTAYKIFAVLNLLLMLLFVFKISSELKIRFHQVLLLSLIFLPVITSIYRGQLTVIALLIFLYIFIFIKSKSSFGAGIVSALLLIKLQYLVAVPFFFIISSDRKKYLKGFILSGGIILLLNLIAGGKSLLNYPQYLIFTEASGYGSIPSEILTLFSITRRLSDSLVVALAVNSLLYILSFIIFSLHAKKTGLNLNILLIVLSTLIFGMHMTDNEVILLLLPLILILSSKTKVLMKFVFALIVLIAPILRFTPFAFFEIILLLVLEAAVFIYALRLNVFKHSHIH